MRTLKQIIADTRLYADYHNEETLVKCVKVWLEEKRHESCFESERMLYDKLLGELK